MDKFLLIMKYLGLLASVFIIFNARSIVPKKVEYNKKNKYVQIVKIIATVFACIFMLTIIYL